MGDPVVFESATECVVQSEVEATFSRATRAKLNETREYLAQTKRSMLDDLSRQRFPTVETVAQAVMDLQGIEDQIVSLSDKLGRASASNFSDEDVAVMKQMKQRYTEVQIAHFFETNQTKVNRLLNG